MREVLETLVQHLGLQDCVAMPGYQRHPYNFMRRADVFVLSSVYEGSPLALAEALAVGVPIVATDCKVLPAIVFIAEADRKLQHMILVRDVQRAANSRECTVRPIAGFSPHH